MMRQVFILLLLLMSASAFFKKPTTPKPYEKFGNFSLKHIIAEPMPVDECFKMLKTKMINKKGLKCKKTNTFIQADVQEVIDVCNNGIKKNPGEGMYESRGLFKLTVCRVTKPGKFPKCGYKGEIKEAKILIKCADVSLPVHFHDEADYEHFGELL